MMQGEAGMRSGGRDVVSRRAWWTWGLLVLLCGAAMVVLLPRAEALALAGPGGGGAWFIVPVLWLVLAVPATLGVYGNCFRGGWGGMPATDAAGAGADGGSGLEAGLAGDAAGDTAAQVLGGCGAGDDPSRGAALRGITSVWVVLTAGVLLSLGACVVAGSATPAVWPGVLMLMLLVLARPSVSPALAG